MQFLKLLFAVLCMALVACNSDKTGADTSDELPPEKKAYYEEHGIDHDGHNHEGHNHDGHNHETPQAIENNSRTSVPVQRKAATPFNEPEENPYKTQKQMQADFSESIQKATRPVPDACSLLSDKFIAKTIGVNVEGITLKDGSSQASPYARSCFFRWDHRGVPNSGVLLQVQDNPVPDEFPEWAAYYIQAKRNQGEKSPDGSMDFKYKMFEGLGEDGAYCYDLHRYMWRDKEDFVYLIAFNLPATEAEELEWARQLGAEVMRKLKR